MLAHALALVLLTAPYKPSGPKIEITLANGKRIEITCDKKGSPQTTKRIVELVDKKFYDGQCFHRVEDWVVQWGDPLSKKGPDAPGVGSSGSGKNMPFEASKADFDRGVVGIASTGLRVGGDSQIFILTRDSRFLNGGYAVLGKVTNGMKVVDALNRGDKIRSIRVKN